MSYEALTDEELEEIAFQEQFLLFCDMDEFKDIARVIEQAVCKKLGQQLALAKQVAIQSQEDAKNQYQKRVELEKFIEGKNGYKERIQQLYEENLRLGNDQIDLADKVREECAKVCDIAGNNHQGGFSCAAAIRATKERP